MYIIIVGAGDIGSQLLEIATRENNNVVVIEQDETVATRVAQDYDCLVLNRDATVMDALEEAGADQADAIISTTESDATNIMVMLLAQELEIPSQVSVVHNPEHMSLFRQLGVNVLENPEHLIAEYLYRAVQRPSIKDFMHLSGDAEIFEITVGESSPLAGRTLAAADKDGLIPDDVRVVAIERDHSVILPQGETEIQLGDLVTVFSTRGFEPKIIEVFVGEEDVSSQAAR
ncbi:TrkA family potassium uptake protein [Halorussus gelatinilyticus]|uniref:TrkA family potassium uptake protein n=1 Tax=Halorussus gelatinilyticus TaxID=2937524 RepID=A0A8U0IHB3_9EURY|nr:TrkA family potassium uptake protein [Halorussus gelatinilyticus]UPW00373.1 TrkA family potassium uptake protein [Halorussus gelatinilyticus]